MNDTPMHARLHTHCTGNPPTRENVSQSGSFQTAELGFRLLSSGDLMVHTASVLLQVPFPEVQPDIKQTQKVTTLNYLRRQRCLAPQKASWGKKFDQLYMCEGQEYYQRKRKKVFHLFVWKEAESKAFIKKKSPTVTISPKQNYYPLFLRAAAVASPGKCSKAKCTPILGGLASSRPPTDIWSPLPKALWPQKKCLRSPPSQGPTSAHPPVPLSSPGSGGIGLPSPSQWNSQMASLIIFKGSFRAGALTFISPPNLLPFL